MSLLIILQPSQPPSGSEVGAAPAAVIDVTYADEELLGGTLADEVVYP